MLGEVHERPGEIVLTLHGELDMLTIDELRGVLAAVAARRPRRLVVDLADVPFVDVLSLSTILATADALREAGAVLVVAGASRPVRRVCALLNADDVLAPDLPRPRCAVN